jgi:hypothetical protein
MLLSTVYGLQMWFQWHVWWWKELPLMDILIQGQTNVEVCLHLGLQHFTSTTIISRLSCNSIFKISLASLQFNKTPQW